MPSKDPLDQPVTLRQLGEAAKAVREARKGGAANLPTFFEKVVAKAEQQATQTDFVKVSFSNGPFAGLYTYRIAEMPLRRVQVGDLVTVGGKGTASVARVMEINVPRPANGGLSKAVAISPEDAERIQKSLGKIA